MRVDNVREQRAVPLRVRARGRYALGVTDAEVLRERVYHGMILSCQQSEFCARSRTRLYRAWRENHEVLELERREGAEG